MCNLQIITRNFSMIFVFLSMLTFNGIWFSNLLIQRRKWLVTKLNGEKGSIWSFGQPKYFRGNGLASVNVVLKLPTSHESSFFSLVAQ